MKIVRSFPAPIAEAIVCERIVAFFTQFGYRQLADFSGCLHFQRGSIMGTLSSFNPIRWASSVNVRVTSDTGTSTINVEIQITHDPFEKRFAEEMLTAEFAALKAAVITNEFNIFDVSDLRKRIAAYVYRVVGLFAGYMLSLVLGILTGMFIFTQFNISSLAASVIGAGIFLVLITICLIVWRRQKKN